MLKVPQMKPGTREIVVAKVKCDNEPDGLLCIRTTTSAAADFVRSCEYFGSLTVELGNPGVSSVCVFMLEVACEFVLDEVISYIRSFNHAEWLEQEGE
jgi:hypothetical protein